MRIAVVDGFSAGRLLVQELNRLRAECVHLRTKPDFRESYTRGFDPDAYMRDLGHVDDIGKAAAALGELGVDRVIAGAESGVVFADTLAHHMGLPHNRIGTVRARRDKAEMARCVREAGLAAPWGARVTSADAAVAGFEENGGRAVVVKPLTSAATDGVHVCRTAGQVRRYAEEILARDDCFGDPNHALLVQEHLDGQEYIVNTVTAGGLHKVVDVWRCVKISGPGGEPVYDYHEPVRRGDPRGEEVVRYTKQAITALGIVDGAAHTEVMLTARGPVLIETGARLMGSTQPWLHAEYSGTSHVHLLALALTDPEAFARFPDDDIRWSRQIRQVYLNNKRAGHCRSERWRQALASLETCAGISAAITPGEPVPQTVDLATVPGYVYLVAETVEPILRDYRAIRAWEETDLYLS
ncbi:ATP-grasp domain-containing protein [Streptomyces leeuwenhoekii]|jgi:biotin carboxylase|uniref:ATP-grasp domain-containing protein n=1 Tax=Streptomyces leeuwenhoekii TaxID=1437453 RepID=UPI003674DB44